MEVSSTKVLRTMVGAKKKTDGALLFEMIVNGRKKTTTANIKG
jgi:hypothetical protein